MFLSPGADSNPRVSAARLLFRRQGRDLRGWWKSAPEDIVNLPRPHVTLALFRARARFAPEAPLRGSRASPKTARPKSTGNKLRLRVFAGRGTHPRLTLNAPEVWSSNSSRVSSVSKKNHLKNWFFFVVSRLLFLSYVVFVFLFFWLKLEEFCKFKIRDVEQQFVQT